MRGGGWGQGGSLVMLAARVTTALPACMHAMRCTRAPAAAPAVRCFRVFRVTHRAGRPPYALPPKSGSYPEICSSLIPTHQVTSSLLVPPEHQQHGGWAC